MDSLIDTLSPLIHPAGYWSWRGFVARPTSHSQISSLSPQKPHSTPKTACITPLRPIRTISPDDSDLSFYDEDSSFEVETPKSSLTDRTRPAILGRILFSDVAKAYLSPDSASVHPESESPLTSPNNGHNDVFSFDARFGLRVKSIECVAQLQDTPQFQSLCEDDLHTTDIEDRSTEPDAPSTVHNCDEETTADDFLSPTCDLHSLEMTESIDLVRGPARTVTSKPHLHSTPSRRAAPLRRTHSVATTSVTSFDWRLKRSSSFKASTISSMLKCSDRSPPRSTLSTKPVWKN